jgi:hypothetical protein
VWSDQFMQLWNVRRQRELLRGRLLRSVLLERAYGATNAMQAGHPFKHLLLNVAYKNRGDPPTNVRTHASHIPRLCSRAQKLNLGGRADRTHITHRTKDQTKLPIKNAHTLLSNSAPPARSILHAITSCDPSGSLLSLLANHHRCGRFHHDLHTDFNGLLHLSRMESYPIFYKHVR